MKSLERFSRAGPRGRGREWATLGVHPLSWLLSNNRLEKVPVVSVPHTSSNRLLLSNQDKGCTPSVAHSLPLPLGPALLNLWTIKWRMALWKALWQTQLHVITWFRPELPQGVQMSALPPFSTLADTAVASSGACRCYPERHYFPV